MLLKGNPSLGEIVQLLNRDYPGPRLASDDAGQKTGATACQQTASGVPPTGSLLSSSCRWQLTQPSWSYFFDSLNDTAQTQGRWAPHQQMQEPPWLKSLLLHKSLQLPPQAQLHNSPPQRGHASSKGREAQTQLIHQAFLIPLNPNAIYQSRTNLSNNNMVDTI